MTRHDNAVAIMLADRLRCLARILNALGYALNNLKTEYFDLLSDEARDEIASTIGDLEPDGGNHFFAMSITLDSADVDLGNVKNSLLEASDFLDRALLKITHSAIEA